MTAVHTTMKQYILDRINKNEKRKDANLNRLNIVIKALIDIKPRYQRFALRKKIQLQMNNKEKF